MLMIIVRIVRMRALEINILCAFLYDAGVLCTHAEENRSAKETAPFLCIRTHHTSLTACHLSCFRNNKQTLINNVSYDRV